MKIAVIILNYNTPENTMECLRSLSETSLARELIVVVVDNASRDTFEIQNEKSSLMKAFHELKIIHNEKNLGFTGGNNIGIQYAQSLDVEYFLVLNNDTIVEKELIQELLSKIEHRDDIGIVVPKIYFAKNHEFHKERYKDDDLGKVIWYAGGKVDWKNVIASHRGVDEVDQGQYDSVSVTDFATGCCMLIKRSVLERVGLFDDKYFLYYEDCDLSMRVKNAGYNIFFAPKAVLWHTNASSTGGSGSSLQDYYISRNRLLLGMRYAPLRSKLALLKEGLQILLSGRKWQKRGVMDFFMGKFGKGSFPVDKIPL